MLFHLSPTENRASILRHGLDPRRMGAARGLAGSDEPELDGVYVCVERDDADWFLDVMGERHVNGLDVWEIDPEDEVLQTGSGNFEYLPMPVPPERVRLRETFTHAELAERGRRGFAALPELGSSELSVEIFEPDDDEGIVAVIGEWDAEDDPFAEPRSEPLPAWLADVVAAGVRDVAGPEHAAALTARYLPDDGGYARVELRGADGAALGEVGFPIGGRGAPLAVAFATALQRHWIERPRVAGTLHPPCPGHRHAAIAEERDDVAWWTCPADGRAIARVGALC